MRQAFRAADDVLRGAVAGIAEVITCPGFINVDFADVKNVMGQMGMAMMGSPWLPAWIARALPLKRLLPARCWTISVWTAHAALVNISTAPGCLLLREYHEIMEIIRNYAHADAEVKFGTAEVDGMSEDEIRVTLIATGLGGGKKPAREERREQLKVVKNGTDGTTMEVPDFQQPDFDKPSVFRARSGRGAPQQWFL